MKSAMLPQILKLEDSFREYERIGGVLSGELKFAILMKSIGGQLKTYLNMTIQIPLHMMRFVSQFCNTIKQQSSGRALWRLAAILWWPTMVRLPWRLIGFGKEKDKESTKESMTKEKETRKAGKERARATTKVARASKALGTMVVGTKAKGLGIRIRKTKMLMESLESLRRRGKENLERARVLASSAGSLVTWQKNAVFDLLRRQTIHVVTMLHRVQQLMQQVQQTQAIVEVVAKLVECHCMSIPLRRPHVLSISLTCRFAVIFHD